MNKAFNNIKVSQTKTVCFYENDFSTLKRDVTFKVPDISLDMFRSLRLFLQFLNILRLLHIIKKISISL